MNKLVVGLTGEIGCGKSYITNLFTSLSQTGEIPVTDIDMDVLAHDLLEHNEELRKEVVSVFDTVERKELSKLVFDSKINRQTLDNIFLPYIRAAIKKKIDESEGLILINGALVIEAGFFKEFCNFQTIIILTPADIQLQNLLKRGYTLANSLQRVSAQMSSIVKYATATELSKNAKKGFVDCIYNYRGDEARQVMDLFYTYSYYVRKPETNIHC